MKRMDAYAIAAVRQIVESLVQRKYDEVERITGGQRLDAPSLERAIRGYGRTLVMPPTSEFDRLDLVEVRDAVPQEWSVRMHLWTCEKGRSDLSIDLSLIKNKRAYKVELNGVHLL
jgi:hypothetical protein